MIEARVLGIPELKAALAGVVPKLRVRALRNALAAGARLVQRAARAATPVISPSAPAVRRGHRKPGTVRQAISVRTSKLARRVGDVGVFVNVRPAKGAKFKTVRRKVLGIKLSQRHMVRAGQRGATSPNDPFYWRFIEFGTQARTAGERSTYTTKGKSKARVHRRATGSTKAHKFLQTGAAQLPQALQVFIKTIGPQIQRLNRPKAPAP